MSKLQYQTQSTKDLSEEEPNHHSKRLFFIEFTISIIHTLLKIALIATSMGFVNSITASQFKKSNGYLRVQENLWLWEQQIITDFRVVKGYNCPEGYDAYSNYSWPGNIQGCFCKIVIGLFEYEVVMQGRCSQKQFSKGCQSVSSHSEILFQFWQPQAFLCVQRLHNYNFYANLSNIINPQGYATKNCSSSTDYQIDLIQPIPCPVTNLVDNSSLNETISGLNYTFERQGNYPVVYFRVSEYNFCQSLGENDISPGRKANYILEKNLKYECSAIDTRTTRLSSQGEATFFRNNPRINQITSTLPAYPQLNDEYIYHLGFVRYPAWSYNCRKSEIYNLLASKGYLNISVIESTISLYFILLMITLSTHFFSVIYYWSSSYFYLKTKYMHGYLYLKDYEIKKVNPHTNIIRNRQREIVKSLLFEICPFTAIALLTMLYTSLYQVKGWFQGVYSCTSQSFIDYLKLYDQFIGSEMVVVMASIFINIGLFCLDICHLLWRTYKGDLQQQEQQFQQANSISRTTNEQISIINDVDFLKQIVVTEEYLIENEFSKNEEKRINIINLDDEEQEDISSSQYSQSSRKSN